MKKTMIVGAIGALLCVAAGVQAQAPATTDSVLPTAGTKEIELSGSYLLNGDVKPYSLNLGYGVFTSPSIEFGVTGGVAGTSGGGSSRTATNIGVFADYYFTGAGGDSSGTTALAPYIGAFVGYSHYVDDTTSVGGQAGVKYFLNPNVAVDFHYQYLTARHADESQLLLGLSTFFR